MLAQHIDSLQARYGDRILRGDEVSQIRFLGKVDCFCGCGLAEILIYAIRIEGYVPSQFVIDRLGPIVQEGFNNRLHVEVLGGNLSVVYFNP